MSALTSKRTWRVLFDHLIDARKKLQSHGEAERGFDTTRLGIIDDGDVNRAERAAKLRDERLQCGAMLANFFKPIERLNVAKKSKKAKRGAPARKKKGMKKATPAKRKKSKASARSGGSVAAARGRFRRQDRRSIDPHRRQQHLSTNCAAAKSRPARMRVREQTLYAGPQDMCPNGNNPEDS